MPILVWSAWRIVAPSRQRRGRTLGADPGTPLDVIRRIPVNGREVDKEVARQAAHRSYAKLLEAGVRVFEYDRTMLHAKALIVDERWANVGSGNFDSRSCDLDLEVNVAVVDTELVQELCSHFLEDLEVSREIDRQTWKRRPVHKRVGDLATEVVRQSL